MARLRFDLTEFVGPYNEAITAGLRREEIAAYLGITYGQLLYRLKALTKRGIALPMPVHGKVGKPGHPCPWKGGTAPPRKSRRRRSTALTQPVAAAPVATPTVEPAPFTFVITVGQEV